MNIDIFKATDIELDFTVESNDQPFDLTGCTLDLFVKHCSDSGANKITKQWTTHYDPTNGKTKINLTDTETDIAVKIYEYRLQITNSSGQITKTPFYEFTVNF